MPSELTATTSTAEAGLWNIYEALIADLDASAKIDAFAAGLHWFGVRSDEGLGLAMAPPEGRAAPTGVGRIAGLSLRETARRAAIRGAFCWRFGERRRRLRRRVSPGLQFRAVGSGGCGVIPCR